MIDDVLAKLFEQEREAPAVLKAILEDTKKLNFELGSTPLIGALLRELAAAKPGGRFLELGTGTGIGTCWILDGMDASSKLTTVDNNSEMVAVARKHLGQDKRVEFVVEDGAAFLQKMQGQQFDFIFADTWPGKFENLDDALNLLAPEGFYIVDDLLQQPNWPEDHAPKVKQLLHDLQSRADLENTYLEWSTGILVAKKK